MDAFSARLFGGNQAGVALPEQPLEDAVMQQVAAEFKHSETAFVTVEPDGSVTLRYFTPAGEVELCGHATIATFALLRALAVRPDYLILDELTSGLDLISQKAIREVLEAYHREYRCSYFLITHDMKFAYRLSQRIYELESGQIVNIGQSNIDINSQERK